MDNFHMIIIWLLKAICNLAAIIIMSVCDFMVLLDLMKKGLPEIQ